MYKIVFVCSGNMCRSPFAEVVFTTMLEQRSICNVEVKSVGTLNLQNTPYDENMVRIANELGYEMEGKSKYMCNEAIYDADLILVMSKRHRDKLTQLVPYANWNRIHLFYQYCLGDDIEVPDPHYQDEVVYRKAADMIVEGCEALANRIDKEIRTFFIDIDCGNILDYTYDKPYKRLKPKPKDPSAILHTILSLHQESQDEEISKMQTKLKELIEKIHCETMRNDSGIRIVETPGLENSPSDEVDEEQED